MIAINPEKIISSSLLLSVGNKILEKSDYFSIDNLKDVTVFALSEIIIDTFYDKLGSNPEDMQRNILTSALYGGINHYRHPGHFGRDTIEAIAVQFLTNEFTTVIVGNIYSKYFDSQKEKGNDSPYYTKFAYDDRNPYKQTLIQNALNNVTLNPPDNSVDIVGISATENNSDGFMGFMDSNAGNFVNMNVGSSYLTTYNGSRY